MSALQWAVACLTLAGCNNPAQQHYDASVDCAANEFPRHEVIDQQSDPARSFFVEDRKIWAILTADAARYGRALDIPAQRVRQEIIKRGRVMRHDFEVGKLRDISHAATVMFEKTHQCLRQSSGGAAAEGLLTIKTES